jgi:membrane protease YdiL (CAAX protease family)
MPTEASHLAEHIDDVYESALVLGGLILLWALVVSPKARAKGQIVRLAAWPITGSDFLLFLGFAIWGGLAFSYGGDLVAEFLNLSNDSKTIVVGATFQLGLLAGVGVFRWRFSGGAGPKPAPSSNPWAAGGATFLMVFPLVLLAAFDWYNVLDLSGFKVEPQPMVDLMGRSGPLWQRITTVVFAVVIAPVTEELVFRAGIFRFLRTQNPNRAVLLSGILFAAVHRDVPSFAPLLVLGVVFALAYERTGDIRTTMVAHALFNLNTTVLVLAGVNG